MPTHCHLSPGTIEILRAHSLLHPDVLKRERSIAKASLFSKGCCFRLPINPGKTGLIPVHLLSSFHWIFYVSWKRGCLALSPLCSMNWYLVGLRSSQKIIAPAGGGVAVILWSSFECSIVELGVGFSSLEYLGIQISLSGSNSYLVNLYHPPLLRNTFSEDMREISSSYK